MSELPIPRRRHELKDVELNRDWLLEKPRDLELQDFVPAEVLSGDWQPLVERAKQLLDGHTGPARHARPLHGLLNVASADPDVRAVVGHRHGSRRWMLLRRSPSPRSSSTAPIRPGCTIISTTAGSARTRDRDDAPRRWMLPSSAPRIRACVFVLENIEDKDPADRRRLVENFNSPAFALSI